MLKSRWSGKLPYELDEIDAAIRDTKTYPEKGAWDYSIKYILMTLLSSLVHHKISDPKIEDFYGQATAMCRRLAQDDAQYEAYIHGLERMWPKLRQQLKDPGFYHFVQDHGMDSAFILPYFSVLSPHAPALEASKGFSVDMAGVYRQIPKSDKQGYEICIQEPTLRSFGTRTWLAQEAILGAALDAKTNGLPKPNLFLAAAGMMPWFRRYHLQPEMLSDLFGRIVAYDSDPKMPEYLNMVFDRPVREYGIEYHFADLDNAFRSRELWGKFQVALATGIMSYYKSEKETAYMLGGLNQLLAPGGAIVFDLQVMEWSMIRCAVSLAWKSPLKPDLNPKSALKRIAREAKRQGLIVEYTEVDPYNTRPTLVNFWLRKPE